MVDEIEVRLSLHSEDWSKGNFRRCSPEARGVWVDIQFLMNECEDRGVLATAGRPWSDEEIAQAAGGDQALNLSCLHELVDKGVAGRTSSGAVYCRRMVRDEEKRRANTLRQQRFRDAALHNAHVTHLPESDATKSTYISSKETTEFCTGEGKDTGKKGKLSKFVQPTIAEIKLQCAKIGLPVEEAEKFANFYDSKGWKVGKTKMANWKSALAGTWKSNWQKARTIERKPESNRIQEDIAPKML